MGVAGIAGEARLESGPHRGDIAGLPIQEEQPSGRCGVGRIPVKASTSLVFHGTLLRARGAVRIPFGARPRGRGLCLRRCAWLTDPHLATPGGRLEACRWRIQADFAEMTREGCFLM